MCFDETDYREFRGFEQDKLGYGDLVLAHANFQYIHSCLKKAILDFKAVKIDLEIIISLC